MECCVLKNLNLYNKQGVYLVINPWSSSIRYFTAGTYFFYRWTSQLITHIITKLYRSPMIHFNNNRFFHNRSTPHLLLLNSVCSAHSVHISYHLISLTQSVVRLFFIPPNFSVHMSPWVPSPFHSSPICHPILHSWH